MEVYCAAIHDLHKLLEKNKSKYNIPPFNLLFSYFYFKDLNPYLNYAKNILIDSGGYSFQTNSRKTISPEKYLHEYKKFIEPLKNMDKVQGIFELDIDNLVGYEKVKEYRAELFEISPKIIPVWHKSLGISEYKKLCQEYDYIAIPCTQNRAIKQQYYGKFIKYAHNHKCKVHGLGMLRENLLNKIPFDSVDGTSWFNIPRFGRRGNKKINSQYIRDNGGKLIFLELIEHIQFQEKMRKKWENYSY